MKNLKRFVFGVASSVLFAFGLARAADHFDPITRKLTASDTMAVLAPGDFCATGTNLSNPTSFTATGCDVSEQGR